MFLDKIRGVTPKKSDKKSEAWYHKLISIYYITILINFLVLIIFWYLFVMNGDGYNPIDYWQNNIIIPNLLMLTTNIGAHLLVKVKKIPGSTKEYISIFVLLLHCTQISMQHNVLTVLLASYILPVMISTLYANLKMTRRTYLLAQILLILSGWRMSISPNRVFDFWIWSETLGASALLLASYFLAKVLIKFGEKSISNFNNMEQNKTDLEAELKLDPLTSLYNHKAYFELFPQILEKCHQDNEVISIAVLDLDNFKYINDIYGHTVGDRVLLRFSSELRNLTRNGHHAFRVGGEEFVLLFQGLRAREAAKFCEELLSTMRQITFPELNGQSVTFSGGIVDTSDGETDAKALFNKADALLYSAKKSGKDIVVTKYDAMV